MKKTLQAIGLVVVAIGALAFSLTSCSTAQPNDDPRASAANTAKFKNMTPGGGATPSVPSSAPAPSQAPQ